LSRPAQLLAVAFVLAVGATLGGFLVSFVILIAFIPQEETRRDRLGPDLRPARFRLAQAIDTNKATNGLSFQTYQEYT